MTRDLNVDQIKKLWVLDLVVKQGSLKKASLLAKVSPSAISQSLSSLEQFLGKPLLIRENGSVAPTQEAVLLLDLVRPAFDIFDRLKNMNQKPVPKMTWINFGTYESIAIDLLPGLLSSLRQKMPDLRLALRISRTSQLLTMIRKGELCSALITEVDDLDRFHTKEVANDRLGVYISKRYPIADSGWTSINEYGLGSLAPGRDGFPRYFSKFMRQFDLPKPTVQSDSFETLRAAAAAGSIAAVLPERVAKRHDDLLEITPRKKTDRAAREVGRHKILIVSQTNCDREEFDFLADEAERLLWSRSQ